MSLAAFLTQTVCFDDTTVKFEIWDTAGQENILSLSCGIIVIIFHVTLNIIFSCKLFLHQEEIKMFPLHHL